MAADSAVIEQTFQDQLIAANELVQDAKNAITTAFDAFSNADVFKYDPYEWRVPSPPVVGFNPQFVAPAKPGRAANPRAPTLRSFPSPVTKQSFGTRPILEAVAPTIVMPAKPGEAPANNIGPAPDVYEPEYPDDLDLLVLPSSELPYPAIEIPAAPRITEPTFSGQVPERVRSITLGEYMSQLTSTYHTYADSIPNAARSQWQAWLSAYLGNRPLVAKIAGIVSTYLDNGGAGIPVPIEEAILTRATDRANVEQRRKVAAVYTDMQKRGLSLPSGALVAGMKEAYTEQGEAVGKVITEVAIKNLELEHDHMKFMLDLGVKLEAMVGNIAVELARVVVESMGQAIELTKTVLTGMVAINDALVKIYLAQWEGYKAAVEVYKAKWQAVELQIRVYEAEIKAELAKTEINRATVEILNAVVKANQGLVEYFKSQVEVETAKVEASRVQIMGFEASVRAYGAQVEAYRVQWDGYRAQTEGEVAKSKIYESEMQGYVAANNGYRAQIEAYKTEVDAHSVEVSAIATENKGKLDQYIAELEGVIKPYVSDIDAYGKQWTAIAEQIRGQASGLAIVADSLFKGYALEVQVDQERAREHLSSWRAQLEAVLQGAAGMTQTANVSGNLAASALNGLTAFAGTMATLQS